VAKLDWTKARKDRPTTETGATRKLDYRADRWLEVVEENLRKLQEAKQTARKGNRRT
jgi:hypothetical protein